MRVSTAWSTLMFRAIDDKCSLQIADLYMLNYTKYDHKTHYL